jgi:hypothetical protein
LVDVSQASNDISLIGGPARVNLVVDSGPRGQRGSQIYTGPGNPTDLAVEIPSIEINDLFINLSPESIDYLYLWQYNSQDGVLTWRKALRLIPNTVLSNPLVKFIQGIAHTTVFFNNTYIDVKGIYFPLASFIETNDVETINPKDFNVQHSVISKSPVSSSFDIREISDQIDVEYLYFNPLNPADPLNGTYQAFTNFPFDQQVLSATFTATEYDLETETWAPLNGYRITHILGTVGGKSQSILDFEITSVNETFNVITINGHGLSTGQKMVYLSNISDDIGGLINQAEYYAVRIDEDTIALLDSIGAPVDLSIGTALGMHSLGILGVGL